ncbi:MAG: MATE family efflux transporter [Alphaproteobacteria bacterium]
MTAAPIPFSQHARALLTLGLPLIGTHLATAAVGLTDTIMLGWYDVQVLAGGVLGASFFFTLFVVGSGFSYAVLPLVASAVSAGDPTQIRRVTRMGLWLSALAALTLLPLMWWSAPILRLIGQDEEVSALAQTYLRIAGWSLLPALLVSTLKSYLAALERAQVVLWVAIFGGLGNALCNWLLIFGRWGFPELGITGAAIATLTNQLIMLGLIVIFVRARLSEHLMFQRLWRPDWEAFARVYRLGWPIGLTHLAESGLFMATTLMMGWIGTLHLAANGIALQLTSTTFMVHLGLSQAATVRAGQAYGARDISFLLRTGQVALALSLTMVGLTMALFLGVPEFLIGLFLDPGDPNRVAIFSIGVGLLAVSAVFQLADGTQVMAMGLLRGVQDTRAPMIMALVSYWVVGVPASYALGFWTPLGGVGIWLGLVLGLSCASALMLHRFWLLRRWQPAMIEPPLSKVAEPSR